MEEAFKRTCPICGKIFYSYDSEAEMGKGI